MAGLAASDVNGRKVFLLGSIPHAHCKRGVHNRNWQAQLAGLLGLPCGEGKCTASTPHLQRPALPSVLTLHFQVCFLQLAPSPRYPERRQALETDRYTSSAIPEDCFPRRPAAGIMFRHKATATWPLSSMDAEMLNLDKKKKKGIERTEDPDTSRPTFRAKRHDERNRAAVALSHRRAALGRAWRARSGMVAVPRPR